MSENVLESRLLRCAMAVVLAVGLTLPTMGALAWGDPESGSPEALEVSDKPLEGADEPAQGPARALGDDVGHGGLAGAGGAVEHHIGDLPALNHPAQQAVPAQNMALPQHLVQALGADSVRQWLVHTGSPFPLIALLYPTPPGTASGAFLFPGNGV